MLGNLIPAGTGLTGADQIIKDAEETLKNLY
jgi:hypothetical protein